MRALANEQNLRRFTPEEARYYGRIGGKKSAEKRRGRKQLKECMRAILELSVSDEQQLQRLQKMGILNPDNRMLLAAALFLKAAGGDVAAFKEIKSLLGEEDTSDGQLERLIAGLKQ